MSVKVSSSFLYGALNGLGVATMLRPLEVLKIRQQCASGRERRVIDVVKVILRSEGGRGFYAGLLPKLMKRGLQQGLNWPMIVFLPPFFRSYGYGSTEQKILTGGSIALFNTILQPLEQATIKSAVSGKMGFSKIRLDWSVWQGGATSLAKRSVSMTTFLIVQMHLNKQYRISNGQVSGVNVLKIGIQSALVVSIVAAPFDVANTLRQAQGESLLSVLKGGRIARLYRGMPLNFLALVVHNVASAALMDQLT